MSQPTIRDVAKAARVGIGTVSRVLNNSQQVSAETRERVQAAIDLLGFRANSAARQLSQRITHRNVGVVLPFITYYAFIERLRGVQKALHAYDNFNLVLYNVSAPDRFQEQLDSIVQQRLVDGLLVISLAMTPEQCDTLRDAGIELVGMSDRCDATYTCFGPDNVAGGMMATEHLLGLGHTRIAYVGDEFPDSYGFPTSEDRFRGFETAMQSAGVEVNTDYMCFGETGRDAAYRMTAELLTQHDLPTAIFAMSDGQALGCMAAIRERGLRVPADISVIGFDDVEISRYVGLTTIRQHLEQCGMLAMHALLNKLQPDQEPATSELSPIQLVVRETTRAI